MQKAKFYLMIAVVFFMGWMIFVQGTQSASSSPLLGFTLTPTTVIVTNTPFVPTEPVITPTVHIITLPPPPQQTPFIIPVTGTDRSGSSDGVINIGLVLVAFGLIAAGLLTSKK
jgi:hypothetical protein